MQALGSLSRLPSAHLQNVPPPSTHLPRRRHTRPRTFMIDADTTAPVGSRCSWAVSLGGRLVWVDSYGQAHGATDTADRWHCAQRCATFHPPAVNVANCACVLVLVLHARRESPCLARVHPRVPIRLRSRWHRRFPFCLQRTRCAAIDRYTCDCGSSYLARRMPNGRADTTTCTSNPRIRQHTHAHTHAHRRSE